MCTILIYSTVVIYQFPMIHVRDFPICPSFTGTENNKTQQSVSDMYVSWDVLHLSAFCIVSLPGVLLHLTSSPNAFSWHLIFAGAYNMPHSTVYFLFETR